MPRREFLAGAAAAFSGFGIPRRVSGFEHALERFSDLVLPAEATGPMLTMRDFFSEAWTIIEPGTPFVPGYHIDAMCEHVSAVDDGEIRNLFIAIGPRYTKSVTCTVIYPTWSWTRRPGKRFMSASYSAPLSTEHAVLSRRIIESSWYQQHWGASVRLTTDQNIKTHYENTARGYRISTSVHGTSFGRGGDVLIGDDLHNVQEIHSKPTREATVDWYRKTWHNRLNDSKSGCRILIGHRGHIKDVGGWAIDNGYVHLKLSTEYDPKKTVVMTPIGWKDPRTRAGELLCPARFGEVENAAAKKDLGSADYAALHGQDPRPTGGKSFKRDWFPIVDAAPAEATRARGWDVAATEDGGDYTVGTRMSRTAAGIYYVEHVVRGQWSSGVVDSTIKQTADADGKGVRIREEQEPGSSGKTVVNERKKKLAGWIYSGDRATGDKPTRWKPFSVQAEAGNVRLVKGAWNEDWLDELCDVPDADHDDQADSAAIAFKELTGGIGGVTVVDVEEG
ncbi:MAG: phage terminase large subunit [Acidobacteriota bacterium]|nr:phage terminase large subunit [Acidobacteriota bacterium]